MWLPAGDAVACVFPWPGARGGGTMASAGKGAAFPTIPWAVAHAHRARRAPGVQTKEGKW
jgi:hypothetical protein